MTNSDGSPSPHSASIPDPYRSKQRAQEISGAAAPDQYRLMFVGEGTGRRPEVLKEVRMNASDLPEAICLAFKIEWPPAATGLILIDDEGREVFGRDNGERIQQPRR